MKHHLFILQIGAGLIENNQEIDDIKWKDPIIENENI